VIDQWLYQRAAKKALVQLYHYEIASLQLEALTMACVAARTAELPPTEAAAAFMESLCYVYAFPLDEPTERFVARKVMQTLQAIREDRIRRFNIARACRMNLFANGVPDDKLAAADPLVDAAVDRHSSGSLLAQGNFQCVLDDVLTGAIAAGLCPLPRPRAFAARLHLQFLGEPERGLPPQRVQTP
jgi:hypothetical protein